MDEPDGGSLNLPLFTSCMALIAFNPSFPIYATSSGRFGEAARCLMSARVGGYGSRSLNLTSTMYHVGVSCLLLMSK